MDKRVATVLIDALFFLVLLLVILPHERAPKAEDTSVVGTLLVETFWEDGRDTDVDLWFQAEGDAVVGYSAKNAVTADLLRDDRGLLYDDTSANYEILIARSLRTGECVVNLHLYRDGASRLPVPVRVRAILHDPQGGRVIVFDRTIELIRVGQELTVARWRVLDGRFVPGSYHETPRTLRGSTDR